MIINVTATQTKIPHAIARKQLILFNEGPNDVRGGWESNLTNDGTATDGMLIPAGSPVAVSGREIDVSGEFFLVCAAGETAKVSYTQKL